jgi:uncharacterized membrane protein
MDWSVLGFQSLNDMMNLHPLAVHFPVALFPASFLLFALGVVLKRRAWCVAGRACLYLALAGAVIALWTGEAAEDGLPHNPRIHRLLEAHQAIGVWLVRLAWVAAAWSFAHHDQRPRLAPLFLLLLGGITLLTAQTADLGGRMVYVEGAGVTIAVPLVTGKPTPAVPGTAAGSSGEPKPHHEDHHQHH